MNFPFSSKSSGANIIRILEVMGASIYFPESNVRPETFLRQEKGFLRQRGNTLSERSNFSYNIARHLRIDKGHTTFKIRIQNFFHHKNINKIL